MGDDMNEDPTTPDDGTLSEDDLDAVTGGEKLAFSDVAGITNPNFMPGSPGNNH